MAKWDRIAQDAAQDKVRRREERARGAGSGEAMKEKVCIRCKAGAFRRVNRVGFVQAVLLPLLGYFPWECALCRRKMFFRDDGRRGERRGRG